MTSSICLESSSWAAFLPEQNQRPSPEMKEKHQSFWGWLIPSAHTLLDFFPEIKMRNHVVTLLTVFLVLPYLLIATCKKLSCWSLLWLWEGRFWLFIYLFTYLLVFATRPLQFIIYHMAVWETSGSHLTRIHLPLYLVKHCNNSKRYQKRTHSNT